MPSLRDELQHIYDQHQRLTPSLVVDEARDEAHPLHDRFEWDDRIAGEKYRCDQARKMIRSVRIIVREPTEREAAQTVRAYHAVRDEQGMAYRPTEEIVQSEFLTKLVMQDMQREWQQLKRKYSRFEEFVAMIRSDLGDEEAA